MSRPSPLVDFSRLDLRPLGHGLTEIPVELGDAAASALGKRNPAHMTALDRWWFFSGRGGCLLSLAGMFFAWLSFPSLMRGEPSLTMVPAALLLGLPRYFARRRTTFASPAALRFAVLDMVNDGLVVDHQANADASALCVIAGLPRGDRKIWIEEKFRLQGEPSGLDLEFGTYCFERRGDKRWVTSRLPYLFVPMPRDLRGKVSSAFRLAPRTDLGQDSDVSLSSTFDREFAVGTPVDGPEVSLFVTRVLAPDVQSLLLDYGVVQGFDLVLTDSGVLARSGALDSVHAEGEHFLWALVRCLHVVHEMFEQLDPAYKLDREAKNAVLKAAGLDATR